MIRNAHSNGRQEASCRVILLGASNLAKGIATAVDTAGRLFGGPQETFIACGHGRSYGVPTWFMGRRAPGIAACGLWDALAARPAMPTTALLTDIGNDLLYDTPVDEIASWVAACLERLNALDAQTAVTLLPSCNLPRLGRRRYLFFRSLFFPRCKLSLEEVCRRTDELNERLERLGHRFGARIVPQQTEWYGLDPIHFRRGRARLAWLEVLASTRRTETRPQPASSTLARWLYLRSLPPETRLILGLERRRPQPAGRLADGTTVAVY